MQKHLIGRAAAIVLVLVVAALFCNAARAANNVLLLFDEDPAFPGLTVINRSLREVFNAELHRNVELYAESLNVSQFKGQDYDEVAREHLRQKYAERRPDLIVAVMQPSLDFLLRHRDTLFTGVPIVFLGIDPSALEHRKRPPDVTGVLLRRTYAPTLDIALRLQPTVRNVFVVGGVSEFDRQLQGIARRDLAPLEHRVRVTWLTELGMDALLKTLSGLPPQSAVLYLTLFADATGRSFSPHEALSLITKSAAAPVYVSVDQYVGLGAVGGHVYSVAMHGRRAAEMGVRILRGEAPSAIAPLDVADHTNLFDWRALQRWNLDEKRLPDGSVVEFRMPSLWETYKWYIAGAAALLLLQSAFVVGLLASRAQRRRAERAASESERQRLRAEDESQRRRDELARALRVTTMGELSASVAHEVRQPLTAILTNAQAARRFLAQEKSDRASVDEALADIVSATRQAADTIDRLQKLFRKERTERAPVDLNELVDDVLAVLRTDLHRKEIGLRFVREPGLPPLRGDPVQLRQVVLNVLVNAEEAIELAAEPPREIRVETARIEPDRVLLTVCDSGVGAAPSYLERMFERFVSNKASGLGMGLAITRSIVEAHDGRVWATRNAGRGLTLHVELPVSPPSP